MNSLSVSLLSASLILVMGLAGCGAGPAGPGANPSPNPSASAPVAGAYSYALPLKVTAAPECGEAEQLMYEVQSNGSFRFYPGDYNPFAGEAAAPLQQRTLSATELQGLKDLLTQADVAKHFEASTPVPEDGPQTMECRTVKMYSLQVNSKEKTYDANGRAFSHTQAYRDALSQIESRLETLAGGSTPAPSASAGTSSPHYGLALRLFQEPECEDTGAVQVEYEVTAAGDLMGNGKNRPLGRQEILELDMLLKELDLVTQYQAQEKVSDDAPQTADCRTIEKLTLDVDGSNQTIEGRRTREIVASQSYLDAIEQLRSKLKELSER
ncbi:MAG: hypothetical protein ACO1RX_11970 [Candidatus Sericytochromatia bacterium]